MSSAFRKIMASLAGVGILSILATVAWRYASEKTATILREAKVSFEKDLNQVVPLGSDKTRVQEFLNSRRMVYIDTVPVPEGHGKLEDDTASMIEARSTEKISAPLGVCWNAAKFRFDSHGKLLAYTDRPVCKGIL